MHERLIENWLDNVNERAFQAPFCQILVSKGHAIIHSSRHCAAEQGKDVITIDPTGRPCAFQLKGNPSSRLTLTEWRKISAQVLDLINIPISDTNLSKVQHKSYLVTNGLVEEEVRITIKALNEGFARDGFQNRTLEIIDRGILLRDFIDVGTNLWPNEIRRINDLLSILVKDGKDLYPVEVAHSLLVDALQLEDETIPPATEVRRRINSASLLIYLTLTPFYRQNNHLAVITGLMLGISYSISSVEKCLNGVDAASGTAIATMREELINTIQSLLTECLDVDDLIEGDPQVDFPFYRPRITLLLGIFSSLALTCKEIPDLPRLVQFFERFSHKVLLWGEGAVPSLILTYYYLCHNGMSRKAETLLMKILGALLLPPDQSRVWKASPYYTLPEIVRHQMTAFLGPTNTPLRRESLGHRSFFTRTLFFLLVRTGRKQACRSFWGSFTKVDSADFIPDEPAAFCLWRTNKGKEVHLQHQSKKDWGKLLVEMNEITTDYIPRSFQDDPFLLALFSVLFPYRMTFDVARHLDSKVGFFRFYAG